MARIVYQLLPVAGQWKVTREGVTQRHYVVKADAVACGHRDPREGPIERVAPQWV
jgi:hypothetical protein